MKKKNGGFTLVELIVVVAIIAVLAAVAALSVNYIGTARAKAAAVGINNMVSKARTGAISRAGTVTLEIIYDNSTNKIVCTYKETSKSIDSETLGTTAEEVKEFNAAGVTVSYFGRYTKNASTTNTYVLTDRTVYPLGSQTLELSFDSSTGALSSCSGVSKFALSENQRLVIRVLQNNTNYDVEITKSTGSHTVTQGVESR